MGSFLPPNNPTAGNKRVRSGGKIQKRYPDPEIANAPAAVERKKEDRDKGGEISSLIYRVIAVFRD